MDSLRRLLSQRALILLLERWFFYLYDKFKLPIKQNDPPSNLNAPVLVNSQIINTAISSVQEYETGSGFINIKDTVNLHNNLHGMGHL